MPFPRPSTSGYYMPRVTVGQATPTPASGNTFPTIGNYYADSYPYWSSGTAITNCSKISKGHVSNSNVCMAASDLNGGLNYPN